MPWEITNQEIMVPVIMIRGIKEPEILDRAIQDLMIMALEIMVPKNKDLVNMDLEMAVSGECKGEAGSELLDLVLDMNGEQLVVVDAEGFHGEYPWSGAHTLNLSFPLQEGATAQGEGWVVVLHLGSLQ